MAVIGLDDTDSATRGMCTTYLGALIAERLSVGRCSTVLIRLNPAIPYKTRGNAAVAVQAPVPAGQLLAVATDVIDAHARVEDPNTNPGLVGGAEEAVPMAARRFAARAIRDIQQIDTVDGIVQDSDLEARRWGNGRGVIGALAAVGAVRPGAHELAGLFDDWTYTYLAYRRPAAWGAKRVVARDSVRAAVTDRPGLWDNVDSRTGDVVCVPHTPCPVLFGVRGDDPAAVRAAGEEISGEPVTRHRVFRTNQGTDAHLRPARLGHLRDGRSYRVGGTVTRAPRTERGGHVFCEIGNGGARLQCAAFEPTKRFRRAVRRLRRGDQIIACGEVSDGTLKLEKFGLIDQRETARVTPTCPTCDRRMDSAGRGQGYRCRDCGTAAPGKVLEPLDRKLTPGWYEVPPSARRHLAKPLGRSRHDRQQVPGVDD